LGIEQMTVLFLEEDTTISDFAARYGVSPDEMRAYNDLGAHEMIPAGRWLIFPKRNVTPTMTPTSIPTVDYSHALKGPFGPNNIYVLHQVGPGESIPVLEDLYLTSGDVIYAANEIKGSIQLGQVLVILPERRDPTGVERFEVHYVAEDTQADALASALGIATADLFYHNGLQSGEVIPADTWVIYPTP
jgi:hypothetical protein